MSNYFFVGIDEAGLGPTLGPLVHGWCGIETNVPDLSVVMAEVQNICHSSGVKPQDSKKLFSGHNKKNKLDSCFAGILSLFKNAPHLIKELKIDLLLNDCGDLNLYPPYANLNQHALPPYQTLPNNKFEGGVCTMLEGELNFCLENGYNKSSATLLKVGKIIDHVLNEKKKEDIVFLIDKQGGRNFYLDFLSDLFPFTNIRIQTENNDLSEYELEYQGREISFSFAKQGDSRYLLVSIASILAKWLRELYMESFNSFWSRYNAVEKTAGYPEDAKRYIEQMSPYFEASKMPLDFIIRRK